MTDEEIDEYVQAIIDNPRPGAVHLRERFGAIAADIQVIMGMPLERAQREEEHDLIMLLFTAAWDDEPLEEQRGGLAGTTDERYLQIKAVIEKLPIAEMLKEFQGEFYGKEESPMRLTVEEIAKVAYDVNREYCRSHGDFSFSTWEQAPEWQRATNVNGVEFHLAGEHEPAESHENWLKVKLDEGWVYGEVKDPARKEHPCCVPYCDLPPEQRAKDYIFSAIVKSLAAIP